MAVSIPSGLTDDNEFTQLLNSILRGLLVQHAPEQLWVIQIDNWFDHKWLGFSGNGSIGSDFPKGLLGFESVKKDFYQDKLTFPPFNPNRVLSQWSYSRAGEDYIEVPSLAVPHKTERQGSESNLHRRVEDFTQSASFVWYSANTLKNGRGSLMVYNISTDGSKSWFASFNRRVEWVLGATKGAARNDIEALMQAP
ncbi:MAG: hypothetical protein ABSG51_09005 [Terracidiphilus sp.]|jgi:hypothetical protein